MPQSVEYVGTGFNIKSCHQCFIGRGLGDGLLEGTGSEAEREGDQFLQREEWPGGPGEKTERRPFGHWRHLRPTFR